MLPMVMAAGGTVFAVLTGLAGAPAWQESADHGWRPHDITGILDPGMEWVQYTTARSSMIPASPSRTWAVKWHSTVTEVPRTGAFRPGASRSGARMLRT
jgi:hypothetical protein